MDWTLHGEDAIPKDLQTKLKISWTSAIGDNEMFWKYEWSKHGTCYYDGKKHRQFTYFNTAYKFWNGVNLFNTLKAEGIVPVSGLGKQYTTEAATKAIKKHYTNDTVTFTPRFMCSNSPPNELYEIIMCLDHDGMSAINCTMPSSCGNLFLWKL
ncbi:ribonuclease 1-like [Lathyrus oleraceus]|uniref:ribonuclease 1-like n=1 Tax=Pisum sativum TaxID=3888 RepID=UPI0021D29993|nr:ribonuclease 1-like [Pisum sativum]